MHDGRRNGNEIGGRLGPFSFFLLDYCGLGRGSARRIVPEGIPSLG